MEYICSDCIGEVYLKKYIKRNGNFENCSYCKKRRKVILFSEIIDIIEDGLLFLYDDPANGLGWEDGGYVEGIGGVQYSSDLLPEYFDCNENVFDDIVSLFSDRLWCKKEFYALDDSEESKYTWETFKNLTKHKIRYFFNVKYLYSDDEYSKYKKPNDILDEILKISNRIKLFTLLEKGTIIYRAREGNYSSSDELSSPEPQQCLYSNRFSPAGISMFYGSADKDTCLEEIDKKNDCSVGVWETQKDILIYDLTDKFHYADYRYFYKNFPSIFDKERRQYYHDYTFILALATDLSHKVIKNRNENIDYVPTQIVTEYLKLNKKYLKGISYYSAITGKKNYCLFIDKQQCKTERLIKMVDSFYIK